MMKQMILLIFLFSSLLIQITKLDRKVFEFGIIYSGLTGNWILNSPYPFQLPYSYLAGDGAIGKESIVTMRIENLYNIGVKTFILTFYRLLFLAEKNLCNQGTEGLRVKCCLEMSGCMKEYFDDWVGFLGFLQKGKDTYSDMDIILHSEPDSWGFMWWAMGIEGNSDALSVHVEVGSSGMIDVSQFEDNARGFSQALIHLRDIYGPDVRLGFHSSNFRTGTRPDVVYTFINTISTPLKWDLLFTDEPHWDYPNTDWWKDWNLKGDGMIKNLNWLEQVTTKTGLEIILWQVFPGAIDYNLLYKFPSSKKWLKILIEKNVIGIAFECQSGNDGKPDSYHPRTIPPSRYNYVGGDALTMKKRVEKFNNLGKIDIELVKNPTSIYIVVGCLTVLCSVILCIIILIICIFSSFLKKVRKK